MPCSGEIPLVTGLKDLGMNVESIQQEELQSFARLYIVSATLIADSGRGGQL